MEDPESLEILENQIRREGPSLSLKSFRGMDRVTRLAEFLDNRFTVPGTSFKIGWDPIIGLIPGVGDTVTMGMGAYIVLEGIRFGARKRVLLKMVFNLFLDWLLGLIPFLDILFDFGFKANAKNSRFLIREWHSGNLKKAPPPPNEKRTNPANG